MFAESSSCLSRVNPIRFVRKGKREKEKSPTTTTAYISATGRKISAVSKTALRVVHEPNTAAAVRLKCRRDGVYNYENPPDNDISPYDAGFYANCYAHVFSVRQTPHRLWSRPNAVTAVCRAYIHVYTRRETELWLPATRLTIPLDVCFGDARVYRAEDRA